MKLAEQFKRSIVNGDIQLFLERNADSFKNNEITLSFIEKLKNENLDLLLYVFTEINKSKDIFDELSFKSLLESYKIEAANQLLTQTSLNFILPDLAAYNPVLLKGSIVMQKYLGLPLYKRSFDIDLLFKRRDIRNIVNVLEQKDYKLIPAGANGEFTMIKNSFPNLDIHYDITASSPFISLSSFSFKSLQKSITKIVDFSAPVSIFNLEMAFVYLCVHWGINHRFNDFILMFEILYFYRRNQAKIRLPEVFILSKRYRISKVVFIALHLINTINHDQEQVPDLSVLVSNKDVRNKLIQFTDDNNIISHIFSNTVNNIGINDVPQLCIGNFLDRMKYKRGNKIWLKRNNTTKIPF
jgi:putative nucleotidyltransferase-like protein